MGRTRKRKETRDLLRSLERLAARLVEVAGKARNCDTLDALMAAHTRVEFAISVARSPERQGVLDLTNEAPNVAP